MNYFKILILILITSLLVTSCNSNKSVVVKGSAYRENYVEKDLVPIHSLMDNQKKIKSSNSYPVNSKKSIFEDILQVFGEVTNFILPLFFSTSS